MARSKRQWIISLVGSISLVAATMLPSLADEGHGRRMHGGHRQAEQEDHGGHYLKHLLKHEKEIGLTPEQVGKLKAMQLDFERTEARTEADIKIAKLELHALLEDEQADLPAIQAKVEQLKKAEEALLLSAIKAKREAIAMLTPDQREKDRARREQMKSEEKAQHGSGMEGMGCGGMMGGMGHGGMRGGGQVGRGGMGGGGHGGQGAGDQGSGEASGAQQHEH